MEGDNQVRLQVQHGPVPYGSSGLGIELPLGRYGLAGNAQFVSHIAGNLVGAATVPFDDEFDVGYGLDYHAQELVVRPLAGTTDEKLHVFGLTEKSSARAMRPHFSFSGTLSMLYLRKILDDEQQ